jgi:tetratricopeptide (TPR) repeat protein
LEGRRIDDSRLRRFVARVFQKPEWQGREVAQKRRYYEDAFRAYYHAIIENPFDSEVFCSLGNTCCALQRYAVAFDAFRQAIRFHPTAEAWAGIGNALAKLQQHQQAIEAYEEALRLDNDVTLDYEELVQALMELGRVQEAEHYRERARELGYYDE